MFYPQPSYTLHSISTYTTPAMHPLYSHMECMDSTLSSIRHHIPMLHPCLLIQLAMAYSLPVDTHYMYHNHFSVLHMEQASPLIQHPTTSPATVYVKEDKTLKLQACPADPKDFPACEKKVRPALRKFNMHHLLDDDTIATEENHKASAKLGTFLLLSFNKEHMKWFMGTEGKQYEECGSEMWQCLCAKILDEEDKDELYDRLLHPQMGTDKSPLDYKLELEQVLCAAMVKKLHINIHQVI
jgi:hypothetical protein